MKSAVGSFSLAVVLVVLASCSSSDFVVGVSEPLIDVSGRYTSNAAVGYLGTLELDLSWIEGTGFFSAWVSSDLSTDLSPSGGIASPGDFHIVINFDRGLLSDYYFEGMIVMNGETVQFLDGQFVFPDQTETLQVVFEYD